MALQVLFAFLITSGCAQEPRSTAWQLLSPGGTPPERGQRAVWSAEADGLFVHGGLPGLAGEPDLGLHFYDRQADEWQQLSPSGSAAARDSHSAVWSPAADGMYIFGGNSYSGERLNELDFYNRQANEWQQLVPGGSLPVARRYHSAVWSPEADGMYLFAGSNFLNGIGHMNDLHFYDRQANRWQQLFPVGSPPSPREHHSAVWSSPADGMYVFGGFNGSNFLNDIHFYDRKGRYFEAERLIRKVLLATAAAFYPSTTFPAQMTSLTITGVSMYLYGIFHPYRQPLWNWSEALLKEWGKLRGSTHF